MGHPVVQKIPSKHSICSMKILNAKREKGNKQREKKLLPVSSFILSETELRQQRNILERNRQVFKNMIAF